MKRLYGLLLLLLPLIGSAQIDSWKGYRYELSLSMGVSNFLGDLGGANQIGTHYFRDLNFVETRFAMGFALRYKISQYFASKTTFSYGTVAGDDKLTQEPFRHNRNLSFRSRIYELADNFEFSFMKEKGGHRYRLHNVIGQKAYEMYTYGFIGIGGFYFNPQAQFHGGWVDLQPLGTEGQGVDPARKQYSRIQLCIPVGIGFKYTVDKRWGFGLEFGIRKTFTDYIDDVSTTYYNPTLLRRAYGQISPTLANRTEEIGGNQAWVGPGYQRGQPLYTDSYMFLMLNINFKLKNKYHTTFQI